MEAQKVVCQTMALSEPPPIVQVMPVRDELRAMGHDLLAPGAKITVQWLSRHRWIVKATVRDKRVGRLVVRLGRDSVTVEDWD